MCNSDRMHHPTHSTCGASKLRTDACNETFGGSSAASTDQLPQTYQWMMSDSEDDDPFFTAPLPCSAMGLPASTPAAEVVSTKTSIPTSSLGSLACSFQEQHVSGGCSASTCTTQQHQTCWLLSDSDADEDPLLTAPYHL